MFIVQNSIQDDSRVNDFLNLFKLKTLQCLKKSFMVYFKLELEVNQLM